MATKRAYVYQDGLEYKVSPAVVILKKTDKFQLVNTTDDNLTWTVPVEIFDAPIKKEPLTKNSISVKRYLSLASRGNLSALRRRSDLGVRAIVRGNSYKVHHHRPVTAPALLQTHACNNPLAANVLRRADLIRHFAVTETTSSRSICPARGFRRRP